MRIAVVGAGVAGLTAAYRLCRSHEVVVFEKSGRIGGNAYSVTTRDGANLDIAVAAFGKVGYPEFYGLLGELGVETDLCASSYMSFHDLDRGDGVYLTGTLAGLLAQRSALLRPDRAWRVARLFLGLAKAQRLRRSGACEGETLGRLIDRIPEFRGETRLILLCALCLLSSMSVRELLDAPAGFFLDKLAHHHDVLSPAAVFSVRCVRDGTRAYINALAAPVRGNIVLGARLAAVGRREGVVEIRHEDGGHESFDRIVFACPPEEALRLLTAPTPEERRLLGPWRSKAGRVVLHRDHSSFPARSLIQAYTFLYRTGSDGELESTSVNGALWHEPQAPRSGDYISSQHPNFPIRPELIELDTVLRTPIYDFASVATIRELPSLNGVLGTYYCGSYFGFGLHEDAVSSALRVAEALS